MSILSKNNLSSNTVGSKDKQILDWVLNAFDIHNTLWLSYRNPDASIQVVYQNNSYPISQKNDFHCAVLPSYYKSNENNFWMTNNMARSTHGTFQINLQKERGYDHQITWIIGRTGPNDYYHKGCVTTTTISGPNSFEQTNTKLVSASVCIFYYGSPIAAYGYNDPFYLPMFEPKSDDIYESNNPPIYTSYVNKFIKTDHLIY